MRNSLVSIILTCYNQEKYLAEALDSVLNQTYPYWECIILNDGSTDGSEEIANQYVSKDKRFIYVYQKNQGVVAARNNAILQSKGKFILPLDGDDKIEPEYMKLAVDVLESHKDVILVYCDVMMFGEKSGIMKFNELNMRNILKNGCCVSTSMYRRETYDIVGGYKSEMSDGWEDWEFFISLLETGGEVFKLKKPLFYYRIQEKSRNNNINNSLELKAKIVSLHPSLYFEEYEKLLNGVNSVKFLIKMLFSIIKSRILF